MLSPRRTTEFRSPWGSRTVICTAHTETDALTRGFAAEAMIKRQTALALPWTGPENYVHFMHPHAAHTIVAMGHGRDGRPGPIDSVAKRLYGALLVGAKGSDPAVHQRQLDRLLSRADHGFITFPRGNRRIPDRRRNGGDDMYAHVELQEDELYYSAAPVLLACAAGASLAVPLIAAKERLLSVDWAVVRPREHGRPAAELLSMNFASEREAMEEWRWPPPLGPNEDLEAYRARHWQEAKAFSRLLFGAQRRGFDPGKRRHPDPWARAGFPPAARR